MAEAYQVKFDALVERERRATEQLQRQQEVLTYDCELQMFIINAILLYLNVSVVMTSCNLLCSKLTDTTVVTSIRVISVICVQILMSKH